MPTPFAAVLAKRRRELGLSVRAIAASGGPSQPVWSALESGRDAPTPTLATFAKLDKVLRWESGSAARTYAGGSPVPIQSRIESVGADSDDDAAVLLRLPADVLTGFSESARAEVIAEATARALETARRIRREQ